MPTSLFQFHQPPKAQPYQSRYSGAIANLVGAGDRARAQALQVAGDASARMVGDLGQQIGTTLAQFAKHKMQTEDPQYKLDQVRLRKLQEEEQDDTLLRRALAANGGDPEKALEALRGQGQIGVNAASKLQKQVTDARRSALDDQHKQLTFLKDRIDIAAKLLPALPEKADDPTALEAFRGAYATVLPQLRATVGKELSQHTPEPDAPDLLARVGTMLDWGTTASQRLEARRVALDLARQGVEGSKDARAADEYFTKALGTWLSTVDSQEEWDQALKETKALGAKAETLAKFGLQWSPEAAARATTFTGKEPKLHPVTVPGVDGPVRKLVGEEDLKRGVKTYVAPNKPPASAVLTPASRASIEQWRTEALLKLTELARATDPYKPAPTPEQLAEARGIIERSYLAQIGRTAPAMPPMQPVASHGAPPPAVPVAPPKPAANVAAPPAVVSMLKGQKPGIYKLSDGTAWTLKADGTITSAPTR
jgi:hypothetical protein